MKKAAIVIIIALSLILSLSAVAAASIVASGNCGANGDNVTWTLDSDGLLTISGTGAMAWYTYDEEGGGGPWGNNITSVVIGDRVTSLGSWSFAGCHGLTSVTIGSGVTSIGNGAFYGCNSLTSVTIPDSVTSIGHYAFEGCSGLTSVTIGSGVTSIGEFAFDGCDNLNGVFISDLAAWCGIDFSYNEGNPNPLYFAHNLYLNGTLVTELVIPDSVTSIGHSAFDGCSSLTSVTIGNGVTSIGNGAFYDCNSLTSVTIPDSVTSIGDGAFAYCSSLTSVTIPDSVTSIGYGAFYNCSLTSVTIPASVTSIGENAFDGCRDVYISNLSAWCSISFLVADEGAGLGYNYNLYLNGDLIENLVIPENVTSIGSSAFHGCSSLTSVTIPASVTSIGYEAFAYCNSLTSVTIGNGVTSIGQCAFLCCDDLTSVTIPDSVTSIGYEAFRNCSSLKDVYYGGTKEQWAAISISSYNDPLRNATKHFAVEITSQPRDFYGGIGTVAKFSVKATGVGLSYQWYYNKPSATSFYKCTSASGTTDTYGITLNSKHDGYRYYCVVTDTNGHTAQSNTVTVHVMPPPVITAQPADFAGYIGDTATFTVQATGEELTYQWYYQTASGTVWKAATASGNQTAAMTVPITASRSGYKYHCVIKDKYGSTVTSDAAVLTSQAKAKITGQPQDYTGPAGSTITFTVTATGDGLTYQWYFKRSGETAFSKSTVAAGKKATFTMTMADKYDGWQYYCVVTDKYGNTAQSATVTIHKAADLVITTPPVDFTGAAGSTITFTVGAAGEGLTYQWYYKKTDAASFVKSTLAAGTKATFTMTMADKYDGWQYYCAVTDAYGRSTTTNTVTIHKAPLPTITAQPQDFTGMAGDTVRFVLKAAGDGLRYQWYFKRSGETAFNKSTVSSATKATFTMTMADKYDGWQYYCLVTDAYGQTVRSNTVKIHKTTDFAITTLPVDYTGPVNSTITFTVAATGDGLTYQWWYKKTGATSFVKSTLASGTKATFTMKMAEKYDGWQYYCVVKDASGNSIRSNTVTIHLSQPLQIVSLPQDFTGAVGSTIKFTVNAAGDDLTYQWWYKKTGATSFVKSTLASGTKATFTMKMAEKYDGWQYYCVVKDAYGNSLRTNTVTIHLN